MYTFAELIQDKVSVPLRGKGRDQRHCEDLRKSKLDVSVPLRGKGRDQPALALGISQSELPMFPSPCGEKVGINGY